MIKMSLVEGMGHRPSRRVCWGLGLATLLVVGAGCGADVPEVDEGDRAPSGEAAPPEETESLAPEQEEFWASLEGHCGNAYRGRVSDATQYYAEMLEGADQVAHFFDCGPERIHVALHVNDDRSRNWILTREGNTLRLKHDHRNPDGSEEEISQYGGDAPRPGLSRRQIFPADDHTARILPERDDNFWFLDLVDAETLHYGVHWPREGHSIRLEFDLSDPVDVTPPPPGDSRRGKKPEGCKLATGTGAGRGALPLPAPAGVTRSGVPGQP